MANKAKGQENELFFVEIKEPGEVRRNILEALKEIVELLQRFEKFRHVRHEKLLRIQKLRVLMKDANKTLGSLKAMLPQTGIRVPVAREQKQQPKKAQKKKETKEEKPAKKERTELEKLESELSAIESKLKSFS